MVSASYTQIVEVGAATRARVLCTMSMPQKRTVTRKAGLITKTLNRYRSMPVKQKPAEGCFSVYAGRQRFVVHTECMNHPLFQALLKDAAEEFGYAHTGPLELPWNAEAFTRVLQQIEEEKQRATGLARRNSYGLLGAGRTAIVGRS